MKDRSAFCARAATPDGLLTAAVDEGRRQVAPHGGAPLDLREPALEELGASTEFREETGFGFVEGPTVDADGTLYFSDIPSERIHRWTSDGGVVTENPVVMLTWAAIISVTILLSLVPAFLGLIFTLPILGHTTWHLYQRAGPLAEGQ